MQTILVANPKGGSGKTTLATNVAGWLAGKRQKVVLEDRDPQRSSADWLARRPPLFPAIAGVPAGVSRKDVKALDPQWLVVDSPAGLAGEALRDAIRAADVMLVPITPSAFDTVATHRFLTQIAEYKAIKDGALAVGLVGMRIDARTHSAADLDVFMEASGFPVVAHLRVTQVYIHAARDGASIFDLPRSRAEQDWEQWRPLTRWIARQAPVKA
ncbi:MAG: AAA family ATPase [Proteobacteria bacterium]|nr:AAA family ATPase [Pseudomonadota bacterium]